MGVDVSIIIPVYNAGEILRRTVKSVLSQTYYNYELILLDDGSTDAKTAQLVDEFSSLDSRIRVYHQSNQGLYKTCDNGVNLSQGEFIYILGQDDFLHPQLIEICFSKCKTHNLDYVALRWETASVNEIPKYSGFNVDNDAYVSIVDNEKDLPDSFCNAVRLVHTDAWAQFIRKSLSIKAPASEFGQNGKTIKCVWDCRRWGVINLPLFFYSVDNSSSIMHKPIHCDWIRELGREIMFVYDYTFSLKSDKARMECHKAICEYHIAQGVKTLFHLIKQSNKNSTFRKRTELWRSFGEIISGLLIVRKFPLRHLGMRRSLKYLIISMAFGGMFFQPSGEKFFHGSSKEIK